MGQPAPASCRAQLREPRPKVSALGGREPDGGKGVSRSPANREATTSYRAPPCAPFGPRRVGGGRGGEFAVADRRTHRERGDRKSPCGCSRVGINLIQNLDAR